MLPSGFLEPIPDYDNEKQYPVIPKTIGQYQSGLSINTSQEIICSLFPFQMLTWTVNCSQNDSNFICVILLLISVVYWGLLNFLNLNLNFERNLYNVRYAQKM